MSLGSSWKPLGRCCQSRFKHNIYARYTYAFLFLRKRRPQPTHVAFTLQALMDLPTLGHICRDTVVRWKRQKCNPELAIVLVPKGRQTKGKRPAAPAGRSPQAKLEQILSPSPSYNLYLTRSRFTRTIAGADEEFYFAP
jgi:hypothetical protein